MTIDEYCHPQCLECSHKYDSPVHVLGDGSDGIVVGSDVIGDGRYINFITGSASILSTVFFPNTAKVYFSESLTGRVMGNSVDLSYSFTVRYGSLYLL